MDSNNNNNIVESKPIELDIDKVKINPEYEAHQPKMSKPQWEAFLISLRANGQIEPTKVDAKTKELFDGHHRYWGLKILGHKTVKAVLVTGVKDPIAYIKTLNEERRHLTKFQLIEQALKEKPKLQKVVKSHESLGGKGVGIPTPLERVDKVIAKRVIGVKATAWDVYQVEEILHKGSKEQIEKARHDDNTRISMIHKEIRYRIQEKRQKEFDERRIKEYEALQDDDDNKIIQLHEGEFQVIGYDDNCVKPNSIDLIITDPYYDEDHLFLYRDVAELACRDLKEGASLMLIMPDQMYTASSYVLKDGNINGVLHEVGTITIELQGPFSKNYPKTITRVLKHMLWVVKGKKKKDYRFSSDFDGPDKDIKALLLRNLIKSSTPDKRFHKMGQSLEENEIPIEKLVPINGVVLDPMVGGGTAAVACKKLKRRFIGIDKDLEAIKATKLNLAIQTEIAKSDQQHNEELSKLREKKKHLDKLVGGRGKLKRLLQ